MNLLSLIFALRRSAKRYVHSSERVYREYDFKVIKSGNVLELYSFSRTQYDFKGSPRPLVDSRVTEKTKDEIAFNRMRSLSRARARVRRLVNANDGMYGHRTSFMTLTFKDDIKDIEAANYEFEKFRKRMEYHYKLKLKYVAVIQFQDKNRGGVIHYHVAFFNVPYIDVNELWLKVWRNGFIKFNARDRKCKVCGKTYNHDLYPVCPSRYSENSPINNMGSYMTKYMVKDMNDDRLRNEKCYFTSRGLIEPEVIKNPFFIEPLVDKGIVMFSSEYENEYQGKCHYFVMRLPEGGLYAKKLTGDVPETLSRTSESA